MLENGYIKLHRRLLGWEWYDDPVTKILFIHLLLTVSIKDDRWHGADIPRGSRVASIPTLAKELGLSTKQIRTGLAHLEGTGSVARKKYPKFTVISIVCWDEYQGEGQAKRQATGKQSGSQGAGKGQQYKNIRKQEERNIGAPAQSETDEEMMERLRRLAL